MKRRAFFWDIIGDYVPTALDVDISISKAMRIVPMFTLCGVDVPKTFNKDVQ